jgi:hypothetical protein
LLFYPFASLLTTFLYFDLAQRQQVLKMDHLAQFSNQLFGTSHDEKSETDKPADDGVNTSPVTENIDPDPSVENKEK